MWESEKEREKRMMINASQPVSQLVSVNKQRLYRIQAQCENDDNNNAIQQSSRTDEEWKCRRVFYDIFCEHITFSSGCGVFSFASAELIDWVYALLCEAF